MEMIDVLKEETIDITSPLFMDKDEMFRHMSRMLKKTSAIQDEEIFLKALYEREKAGTTFMGDSIALPHGRSDTVVKPAAAICRCSPFKYISGNDSGVVRLVVALAIPQQSKADSYIKMLSNLSRLLMNERFTQVLTKSESTKEIIEVYKEEIKKLPLLS